jgi:hypothetical protein
MACSDMSIQAPGAQAQSTQPGTTKGPEVEGRGRDAKGEQVALGDGTTLTVPKSRAELDELEPGAMIKATYEERDGKKIVTSLRINEGPQAGSGSSKRPLLHPEAPSAGRIRRSWFAHARFARKNSLSLAPHAAPSTPAVTAMRWVIRGSSSRR